VESVNLVLKNESQKFYTDLNNQIGSSRLMWGSPTDGFWSVSVPIPWSALVGPLTGNLSIQLIDGTTFYDTKSFSVMVLPRKLTCSIVENQNEKRKPELLSFSITNISSSISTSQQGSTDGFCAGCIAMFAELKIRTYELTTYSRITLNEIDSDSDPGCSKLSNAWNSSWGQNVVNHGPDSFSRDPLNNGFIETYYMAGMFFPGAIYGDFKPCNGKFYLEGVNLNSHPAGVILTSPVNQVFTSGLCLAVDPQRNNLLARGLWDAIECGSANGNGGAESSIHRSRNSPTGNLSFDWNLPVGEYPMKNTYTPFPPDYPEHLSVTATNTDFTTGPVILTTKIRVHSEAGVDEEMLPAVTFRVIYKKDQLGEAWVDFPVTWQLASGDSKLGEYEAKITIPNGLTGNFDVISEPFLDVNGNSVPASQGYGSPLSTQITVSQSIQPPKKTQTEVGGALSSQNSVPTPKSSTQNFDCNNIDWLSLNIFHPWECLKMNPKPVSFGAIGTKALRGYGEINLLGPRGAACKAYFKGIRALGGPQIKNAYEWYEFNFDASGQYVGTFDYTYWWKSSKFMNLTLSCGKKTTSQNFKFD
jgi:hypothetical protein